MRNKIKLSLGACVLSVSTILFVQQKEECVLTPLLEENVEALALGEDYNHIYCVGNGTIDCPESHVRVRVYETFRLPQEKY